MAGKKKVAKKKTPVKKEKIVVSVTEQINKKAPKTKVFVLQDGKKIETVKQLLNQLEEMNDDMFMHHTCGESNDFCNWLRDVFDYKDFAKEMEQAHNRLEAQRKIMRKIIKELK